MTDFSPRLAAFAAQLKVESDEALQVIYQYCLAMLLVEESLAELTRIEILGREPWCTFKTSGGDFTLLRPSLSQAEERRMIEILRQVAPRRGSALVEEINWLISSSPFVGEADSVEEFHQPEDIAAAAPVGQVGSSPAPFVPEAPPQAKAEANLSAAEIHEAAAELQQVVKQALNATELLQAILAEVRQVAAEAKAAAKEQRSILAQMQNAARGDQRRAGAPEPPLEKRPTPERDKQITLAILEGLSWAAAGQKFGITQGQAKRIYITQFRRLHQLEVVFGLTPADVAALKKHERPYFSRGHRPYAERMRELLEKMWACEEGS